MSLDVSRIRALCFDVDGTLRDTDDQLVARLETMLHPMRFLLSNKDPHAYARRLVMALEDPATWLYTLLDRLSFDQFFAYAIDWFSRKGIYKHDGIYWVVEGIEQMLENLYPRYPMAVVTARGERGTLAFLEHSDLGAYFQTIATSQTCRHTKPFPDPILWVAERMGVPPETCLMVGDTTVDIRAGKAAGAQTVGVLCGLGQREELVSAGADLVLSNTSELTEVLIRPQEIQA